MIAAHMSSPTRKIKDVALDAVPILVWLFAVFRRYCYALGSKGGGRRGRGSRQNSQVKYGALGKSCGLINGKDVSGTGLHGNWKETLERGLVVAQARTPR